MSFYVSRTRVADDPDSGREAGEVGWVGPIRSEAQAQREAAAWMADGSFTAEVHPSTVTVKASVRLWQREVTARRRQLAARA